MIRTVLRRVFFLGHKDRRYEEQLVPKRIDLVKVFLLGALFILVARSIYLHLFSSAASSLQNLAEQQYHEKIKLAPNRGTIYDHRNLPLALSVKTTSIAVNPHVFQPTREQTAQLSKILQMPSAKIQALTKKKSYFAWMRRKVPNDIGAKVQILNIKGVHFLTEASRYYPAKSLASNLLGYVGIDNTGLLGIELKYDSYLSGTPSKVMRFRDARGNSILLNTMSAAPEQSGFDLVLTIDKVIQEITEEALEKGTQKSGSQNSFAIVADPHTGRILAIANRPRFNPEDAKLQIQNTRDHAATMLFEPGSIVKPFVIGAAIEGGKTTPTETHNCEKDGRFKITERVYIHDEHPKEFMSTAEILIHSSNICTAKIAQRLGPERVAAAFANFGFGEGAILGLPGERPGRMAPWRKWTPIRFANVAFGQGFVVSGLEMVQAYSAFANGGNLVKPFVVESIQSSAGEISQRTTPTVMRRILSPPTVKFIRAALARVVSEGTGTLAMTQSYTTAGKTGTAEKYDPTTKSYGKSKRTASFIGFAPVTDPHLVVFVVMDEPKQKPYYGGKWAAPVFGEIVEKTLKYLNVAPDKIPTTSTYYSSRNKE